MKSTRNHYVGTGNVHSITLEFSDFERGLAPKSILTIQLFHNNKTTFRRGNVLFSSLFVNKVRVTSSYSSDRTTQVWLMNFFDVFSFLFMAIFFVKSYKICGWNIRKNQNTRKPFVRERETYESDHQGAL